MGILFIQFAGIALGICISCFIFLFFISLYDSIQQKNWKRWSIKGYDKAVNDILGYGWYYNKDNVRIYICEGEIPTYKTSKGCESHDVR